MRNNFGKTILATAVIACMFPLSAAAQKKTTVVATNWMATTHVLNRENYQKWAEDVARESKGNMKVEVHSSGSLVPARSTMQGIRDSVASVGIVYPGYNPSEFPLNNVINDVVFVSDDDIAAAFAYTELSINNDKLRAEWSKNGGVFLGGYATPVYNFVCNKTVRDVKDAQGLKIRTAGGAQNEWVKLLGGVPVSVPSSDVYTGLERGSIDCTMSDPSNLGTSYKYWEVAKSVTQLPMGVVLGASYVFNPKTWKGYTTEQRQLLIETISWGIARSQVDYHKEVIVSLKGAKERGLALVQPTDALKAKLSEFNANLIKDLPKSSMQTRRIADPSAVLEEYLALEKKWKVLLKDVDRTNVEAVHTILYENLYKNVDASKYGV